MFQLFKLPWKITEAADVENPSSRVSKLIKPANSEMNFPLVSFKREDSYNHHRFKIMYYLNHKNLLHMLAADRCKTQAGSFDTFVEPTQGTLISICDISACADDLGHIPSRRFQSIVRQMFNAIEFLREHSLYHGDLSWINSLFAHPYTVKLAGFMRLAMTIEQAQFYDRKCLANMLRHQLNIAIQNVQLGSQIFYAHLKGLIRVLEREDLTLRDNTVNIIDNTFFWAEERRTSFYTTVVSLRVKDERFQFMIYHRDVCAMPWSKGSNIDYWTLLDTMNNYRKNHDMKLYDFKCPIDFLRCVCGAYTHKHELKFNIDKLIREVHPALSIVMKRLVETFDSSGFVCNDKSCSTCKNLRRVPQMRRFVEEKYSR